jgi:predicted phosphodiesterase
MRLGLVGDVHAEDERLAIALDRFASDRVDRVLCTGDVADGHGDLDRTCALLRQAGVLTVRGNHDRWLGEDTMRTLPHAHRRTRLAPASLAFLTTLPPTIAVDLPEGKLLLCHGVGTNDMYRLDADSIEYAIFSNDDLRNVLSDPTIAIMVGGHTHRPFARHVARGAGRTALLVVNAGTLAREYDAGFSILDTTSRHVDRYAFDAELRVRLVPGGIS